MRPRYQVDVGEAPFARFLFGNTAMAPFWLIIRLYVGWTWFSASLTKIGSPSWTGENAGAALSGFIRGALAKTAGAHPDVQGWYAMFLEKVILPNADILAPVIAWGEFIVGMALLLGLFTGIVAFIGLFINLNFMLAGALSVNPILFTLSIGLMLAWRVSGYVGLDRYLLPRLGVPWGGSVKFKAQQ